MEKIKYKEKHDYIIAYLYLIKQDGEGRDFSSKSYSLRGILKHIHSQGSSQDIFNIAKYLRTMGYVDANFMFGDVFLSITSQGTIYVEEHADKELIDKVNVYFQEHKNDLAALSNMQHKEIKVPIFLFLDKFFKENIIKEFGKTSYKTQEYKKDIDIIKLELEKKNPSREVLHLKINALKYELPTTTQLQELEYMLNLESF